MPVCPWAFFGSSGIIVMGEYSAPISRSRMPIDMRMPLMPSRIGVMMSAIASSCAGSVR